MKQRDKTPKRAPDDRRKFLEALAADCRRAGWPGSKDLLYMIDRTLAEMPAANESRHIASQRDRFPHN